MMKQGAKIRGTVLGIKVEGRWTGRGILIEDVKSDNPWDYIRMHRGEYLLDGDPLVMQD